jgi:L-seryl-tRNA(Ser) seleniumtransferase
VVGFTAMPPLEELAALARERDLPLIVDQGTGHLHRDVSAGLGDEPTVAETLAAGADVVCFSGDKLLGGPQAGLIVGSRRWVEPLGRHPLYRALRPDKTALVLMDRTLAAHRIGRLDDIPLYALLRTPLDHLQRRARAAARRLRADGIPAAPHATRSTLGGGTTPAQTVPGFGIAIESGQELADRLRIGDPPVVALVVDDRVVLDLRTVFPAQDHELVAAVGAAWNEINSG